MGFFKSLTNPLDLPYHVGDELDKPGSMKTFKTVQGGGRLESRFPDETDEEFEARQMQYLGISNIDQNIRFEDIVARGEENILQNASATGNLRGGNVQGQLAQFRPNVLNQLINEKYNKLAGLSGMGQAAAAGQAQMGMNTGMNISNLYGQQGSAQAANALAQGQANSNMWGSISQGLGGALGSYFGGAPAGVAGAGAAATGARARSGAGAAATGARARSGAAGGTF